MSPHRLLDEGEVLVSDGGEAEPAGEGGGDVELVREPGEVGAAGELGNLGGGRGEEGAVGEMEEEVDGGEGPRDGQRPVLVELVAREDVDESAGQGLRRLAGAIHDLPAGRQAG